MLAKPKPFPLPPRLARSPLVQNPLTVLAVNWLCQGLRGMGRRERRARLAAEASLVLLLWPALVPAAGAGGGLLLALLLAHTLQWTLNGQFWVVMRYLPGWHRDPAAVVAFRRALEARLRAASWLREAVITGSLVRRAEGAGPHSDIDVRLVYPPRAAARLRADLLALALRARAFLRAIPLDLYLEDRVEDLARLDPRDPWRLVVDRDGRIRRHFAGRRRMEGP